MLCVYDIAKCKTNFLVTCAEHIIIIMSKLTKHIMYIAVYRQMELTM